MENSGVVDDNLTISGDGPMQPCSSFKGNENLGDYILDDFDSYFEDINERLIISRIVSDSVIEATVNAVTEEAAEKLAFRELEVASLKERLHFYESSAYKVEESKLPSFSSGLRQDVVEECLGNLRMTAEQQFQMLENKIQDIKWCGLNQHFELLGGERKESEKWAGVDQTLNSLRNTLKTVCTRVDNIVCSSRTSLCEWQKEQEFQDEVGAMVIQTSIRSLPEEFEVKLWERRAQFCASQRTDQLEKIKELSSIRQELNSISRCLSNPEMGQLPPNGSHEGGEDCSNAKRKDHFLCKVSSNQSLCDSLREANGKNQDPKTTMPETMESTHLKHMSKDELISYFKSEMNKMNRNHESLVQAITEEYYSLKREFLKERGPSSLRKESKDKEFEAMRKKIPEVIVKLDGMLMEDEKLLVVYENNEIICSLKNRIDTLLTENRQFKDLLTNKNKEVKCLSSQVSDAADKMSNHSLAEVNLLKQIKKLKCDIGDMKIEISVREDVCKCILEEFIGKIKWAVEDSNMESLAMLVICEIVFSELVKDAQATIKCAIEDSEMESISMQELSGIIFREAAKDALHLMKMKYEEENEKRVSLEASVLENEKALSLEREEKEQLKHKIPLLMEEKEKLLMKEKERYDLIYHDFNSRQIQQERLLSESRRESNTIKSKLEEALGQIQLYEEETSKLDQKLKLAIKDLKGAHEEIKKLLEIVQEKENALSLVGAKEMEQKKQVESTIVSVQRLFKEFADFEGRAVEVVEKNNVRLKRLKFQCDQKATLFRRMELVYKQRLERRYSDLQKAEAEVDLLGDEVDVLLNLLEKIYIALDHYSPVLQHYPGVMEILKLIRRELSVETTKPI